MDYHKHYELLITRAKTRKLEGYKERHHIIPRCMGGEDDRDNLVELTAEEHFVAHQLLVKMFPQESGLIHACHMMSRSNNTVVRNNKMYSWLRKRHSIESSRLAKQRIGKKNGSYGRSWYHDPETLDSGKFLKEEVPSGWVKGRKPQKVIDKNEKLNEHYYERRANAYYWYKELLSSNASSIREFIRKSDYTKTHISFIKMLKKYVDEFNPQQGKKFRCG